MKKHCLLCLVFVNMVAGLYAQSVAINTDGSNADASAILDVKSTDKGVLIPRLTAVQRMAIANPAKGLLVFQTEPVPAFCYYNGMAWINLGNGNAITAEGYSSNYGFVTTFAGSGNAVSEDGIGTAASFPGPIGIATDTKGNFYVASVGASSVQKITSTSIVSTLAGVWDVDGYVDGTGTTARFNNLIGMVADSSGNLYVTDNRNALIRKITPGGLVTTIAGRQGISNSIDGDSTTTASFRDPYAITRDASGNLYVCQRVDHTVRKIDTAKRVTTIGGISGGPGLANGNYLTDNTFFRNPSGITVDAAGNVYIADEGNHVIRKIDPAGNITTFAGTGSPGASDGTLTTATFNLPTAIVIDPGGNFFVADRGSHTIRKISTTGIVSTIAGTGLPGYVDGSDVSASFNRPSGLALDPQGNLYVADQFNQRVRKIFLH